MRVATLKEESSNQDARRFRKTAFDKFIDDVNMSKISLELTHDTIECFKGILAQSEPVVLKRSKIEGTHAIVLAGTASRGEMAPHSDVDFVVLCENDKDKAAAEELGRQLNLIRVTKGDPFNADPAIDGNYGMTLSELVERAISVDLVCVGGEASLLARFRTLFVKERSKSQLLGSMKAALEKHRLSLLDKRRSVLATAQKSGWPNTDVNVKTHLLRFLITTMATLAPLEEKTSSTPVPMSTVERIQWMTANGSEALQVALKKDGLGNSLVQDFEHMQEVRYKLHFEKGKEVDEFQPDEEVTKWLPGAVDRLALYGEALASLS
jgi:UTP:GlnB (protein PII) uridylyltransferase